MQLGNCRMRETGRCDSQYPGTAVCTLYRLGCPVDSQAGPGLQGGKVALRGRRDGSGRHLATLAREMAFGRGAGAAARDFRRPALDDWPGARRDVATDATGQPRLDVCVAVCRELLVHDITGDLLPRRIARLGRQHLHCAPDHRLRLRVHLVPANAGTAGARDVRVP